MIKFVPWPSTLFYWYMQLDPEVCIVYAISNWLLISTVLYRIAIDIKLSAKSACNIVWSVFNNKNYNNNNNRLITTVALLQM